MHYYTTSYYPPTQESPFRSTTFISFLLSSHTAAPCVHTHTHTRNNHRADLTSLLCALRQLPTRVVAASATTTRWRLVTEKRLVTQQAGCWNRRPKAETVGWKPCTGRGRVGMCCRVSVYHGVPCPSSPSSPSPPAPDGCAFGQEIWSSIPRLIAEYHHSAW